MLEEFLLDLTKMLESIINHSLTVAVLTGLVSIIVVKMQKNNKKQEIDYLNEAEIKKEVRVHATKIITCTNEIAVGINSYVSALEETINIINKEKEELIRNSQEIIDYLNGIRKDKTEKINTNSNQMIYHLIQFELYFADNKYEHEAVKKSKELQNLTEDLKENLFKIQENISIENLNQTKKVLEQLSERLDILIPEFSIETRKSLRLYIYKLHGKPKAIDRISNVFILLSRCIKKINKNRLRIAFVLMVSIFTSIPIGLLLEIVNLKMILIATGYIVETFFWIAFGTVIVMFIIKMSEIMTKKSSGN